MCEAAMRCHAVARGAVEHANKDDVKWREYSSRMSERAVELALDPISPRVWGEAGVSARELRRVRDSTSHVWAPLS